jgi:hypothetical protein
VNRRKKEEVGVEVRYIYIESKGYRECDILVMYMERTKRKSDVF